MSLSTERKEPLSPAQSLSAVRPRGVVFSGPQEEESLRNSIRVLRKNKFLVFGWMLGALVAALLICALMHNQYTATATLLVDKDNSSGLDLGGLSGLASAVGGEDELKVELQTHATVLQSDSTMLKVVENTGLNKVSPYAFKPGIFAWVNSRMKAEQGLPLDEAPFTRERLLNMMSGRLNVKPTEDTRLITVAYRDSDPKRAAAIANNFVNTYIHEYLQTKFHATAQASDWLSGQLDNLKSRVQQSQQKLSDYERQTGLSVLMLGMGADTSSGGSSGALGGGVHIPAVDKLAALNQELTAAEADRISKEAIYRLTQTQSPDVVLGLNSGSLAATSGSTVLTQGSGLAALEALRQQQTMLQVQYGDALTKYGAKNPHLSELQAQLSTLNQSIEQEMTRINQRAKNDFELAKQTEDAIQRSYVRQQGEVNKLNDSTVQLELLAGEALSSRVLYDDLYSKLQEANIAAGVQATNLSNVDPARPPAKPSRPLWLAYSAIALGAGLLLGTGAAFVRENLDDSIVTPDQIEDLAWFPVLSYIPRLREKSRGTSRIAAPDSSSDSSMLVSQPNTPVAEAYRALRTAIQLSTPGGQLRTLLVTSPMGADGKTTSAYNLAITFAQSGIRVLLIDADMRKPRLNKILGIPRSPGLADVLTGGARFSDTLKPHPVVERLFVLPAGTSPPNPADLLGSRQLETLFDEALLEFDLVIIDSPPVLMVTDPVILSTKVNGTILVIRSGATTKMVLRRASETLSRSSGHKLGIVINAVDTRSIEYYYSYGYYGDNKYYGEEA